MVNILFETLCIGGTVIAPGITTKELITSAAG